MKKFILIDEVLVLVLVDEKNTGQTSHLCFPLATAGVLFCS